MEEMGGIGSMLEEKLEGTKVSDQSKNNKTMKTNTQ